MLRGFHVCFARRMKLRVLGWVATWQVAVLIITKDLHLSCLSCDTSVSRVMIGLVALLLEVQMLKCLVLYHYCLLILGTLCCLVAFKVLPWAILGERIQTWRNRRINIRNSAAALNSGSSWVLIRYDVWRWRWGRSFHRMRLLVILMSDRFWYQKGLSQQLEILLHLSSLDVLVVRISISVREQCLLLRIRRLFDWAFHHLSKSISQL